MNHFRQSKPLEGIYFTTFAREILEKKSRRKSEHYAAVYDAIIKHIDAFSVEFDCDIYTNSVTAEFLDDFIIYLEDQGLRHNTIVGYIQKIQTLVRRAAMYNYAVDNTYNEIDLETEPTNAVFLSMNEITRIYYYKFVNQDKRMAKERIRDLFVLGCLTALRYSDYSTLTADNLQDRYIVKRTKKTNVDVKVPAHDYVLEIFAKYHGCIPCKLCIQYFNKYLKVIMKEIGLTDKIAYSFTKGGRLQTVTKEKWQLISSHTARRSAATNMYLTGRMKTLEIMRLTGHRTEQNFFRYIRLTNDDTARSISGDMFFRK
ncbi:phage integrase SAM-like domain-containing protein [Bacteroides sp.]|uniref:phage integrase SAM-like domain-containing protein n=1 Tax=Bacteroides sp. TaxID=29523 RepID=UPI00260E7FAA|nr:phage integrase SAM-like domain-containing protein [Bacteroides sp.]MDD3040916.1 phage integrase SAM-like domain-containing protein [Bacteroides sp.]